MGHVEVAAEDERLSGPMRRRGIIFHLGEELHLGRKIPSAVRHVNRRNDDALHDRRHDAVFQVERRMDEFRRRRREVFAHQQRHARIALQAMPETPVAGEFKQTGRNLLARRLGFLQTDDVGLLAFDPCQHLLVSRADTVDVPSGDFHGKGIRRDIPLIRG
jgi:hypothetical protein